MSPGDRLLYAISAQREMSWTVFKRTFELLCVCNLAEPSLQDMTFARYAAARALDALAHIEADLASSPGRLYAAPPALSLLPGSGLPVALLSGARAPSTIDLFSTRISNGDQDLELEIRPQRDESKCF